MRHLLNEGDRAGVGMTRCEGRTPDMESGSRDNEIPIRVRVGNRERRTGIASINEPGPHRANRIILVKIISVRGQHRELRVDDGRAQDRRHRRRDTVRQAQGNVVLPDIASDRLVVDASVLHVGQREGVAFVEQQPVVADRKAAVVEMIDREDEIGGAGIRIDRVQIGGCQGHLGAARDGHDRHVACSGRRVVDRFDRQIDGPRIVERSVGNRHNQRIGTVVVQVRLIDEAFERSVDGGGGAGDGDGRRTILSFGNGQIVERRERHDAVLNGQRHAQLVAIGVADRNAVVAGVREHQRMVFVDLDD